MTPEHKQNLLRLAEYLEGELKAKFDMEYYSELSTRSYMSYSACELGPGVTACGSVGCAVGHGPYAGIPKEKDEYWTNYAHRVFGKFWGYAFHGSWSEIPEQNTPRATAARIRLVAELGREPDQEQFWNAGMVNYMSHKSC